MSDNGLSNNGSRGSRASSTSKLSSPPCEVEAKAENDERLAALRAEAAIEDLGTERSRLLTVGRAIFGVVGRFEYGPLGVALRSSGLRVYPAIVLGLAGAIPIVGVIVWPVLSGDMATTLGIGSASVFPILVLVSLAAGGLVAVGRADSARRPRLVIVGCLSGVPAFVVAALSNGFWGLAVSAAIAGFGAGAGLASHYPLLMDTYRPEVRVRMFTVYTATALSLSVGALAVMSVATGSGPITWRGVMLVFGAAAVAIAFVATRLDEAETAAWDGARLARLVHQDKGGLGPRPTSSRDLDLSVSQAERLRRIWAIPSARPVLGLVSAAGLLLVAFPVYVPLLLRDRFSLHKGPVIELLALAMLGGVLGLVWFARRGEVAFRSSPRGLLRLAAWAGSVAAVAFGFAAVSPTAGLTVTLLGLSVAGLAVMLPASAVTLLSVVDPSYRPDASFLIGVFTLAGGIAVRSFVMDTIASRFGLEWAFEIAAVYLVLLVGGAARAARTVEDDLDSVVGQLIDAAELDVLITHGRHVPLLACHQVDFSYGQLQVLFGVDFTIDDGEMIALLGTNGAGKSTLLKAISGIGFPNRGSIHYRGDEVTYVAADRRVRLGISQVPGGRAVFGPMSVADNLRVFAYTHGRDPRAVEAGIEASFDIFPRLAERRDQLAATLSGGEQQMLALTKAFILQPRLLLVDELSLGLAPKVVAELLELVRRINATGTAVVLVEQSVNIALSLVHHAYFMEKGEMRFDGAAGELLARPDLLRSVFLGAGEGVQ